MTSFGKILGLMRSSPSSVRFADLEKVCTHYFGLPRLASGSHVVFKTPWFGDPESTFKISMERLSLTKSVKH